MTIRNSQSVATATWCVPATQEHESRYYSATKDSESERWQVIYCRYGYENAWYSEPLTDELCRLADEQYRRQQLLAEQSSAAGKESQARDHGREYPAAA